MLVSDDDYPKYWYMPVPQLIYRQLTAKSGIEFWEYTDTWAPSVASRASLRNYAYRCRLLEEPRPTGVGHNAVVRIEQTSGKVREVEC